MAGIIIKNKLKPGEKITGSVVEVFEKAVVLEFENEKKVKLPLPEEVCETLSADYDGEIVEISLDKDGEYSIEDFDDWDETKKKK